MRNLNQLIQTLEELRIEIPENEREEWFNQHLDIILDKIESWSGMNEPIGHKVSLKTRKACLAHLIGKGEITEPDVPYRPYYQDWYNRKLDEISRYHFEIILQSGHKRVRDLGKKGIGEIEEALK